METNKSFLKKLAFLMVVMVAISVIGGVVSCAASKSRASVNIDQTASAGTRVVTSFYPMYILTKNLLRYTDSDVSNMTTGLSGCIHDYQVTTDDMRNLSKADIFVVNGMGMETFVSKIAAKYTDLPVFTASGSDETADSDENPHLWMNPSAYLDELNNLHAAFTDYYMSNGYETAENGLIMGYQEYGEKILDLMSTYNSVAESLSDDIYVICYNEAFEPFAEGLGLNIISVFSLDEDEMPSAGEVAEAIEEAKKHDKVLILIEEDLAYHADKVVAETGAAVVYIDPLTSGSDDYDSYINGMTANIDAITGSIN